MRSKESFNTEAELYDEVRPSYPDQVIDFIITKTGISMNDCLLEIAPGTGQATMKFGERGFVIHAVELGDNLANILLKNCADMNVTVDVSPFEEWIPKTNKQYPMIYCATAFHWLDPLIRYQKCSDLLEPNGYLVLLWNNAVSSTNSIMQEAYKKLFSYYPERPYSTKGIDLIVSENRHKQRVQEIEESGCFKMEDYIEYKWNLTQTKEQTIKGFFTQSSYLSLDNQSKKELTDQLHILFEQLDDQLDSEFITTAYICKKTGNL